jgi:predicted CXXCH cytochrome family protein
MNRLIYAIFALLAFLLIFCNTEKEVSTSEDNYLNLAEEVKYVGMQTCMSCHPQIHETFIHTGMGRSFHYASQEKSDATFGDHAVVYDTASNFYYKPFFEKDNMYVLEYRLEGGDTIHKRLEQIDYIVGSGQHTNSHIIDINGYIYQAPVTYYTQEERWDMAPGFRGDNIRFSRLLASECITCHNHFPEFEQGSMNKYSKMPTGIECERCHGPGEVHVREKLKGNIVDTANYIDYTIVNPRKLSRDLQMDLCQRCHLQGIAVLNEGKDFFDFRPGMALNEVFNVFLPRYTNSDERFIMASQADRLRLSECYKQSEMTCITCHNPHKSIEITPRQQYNQACMSCHTDDKTICTASEEARATQNNDCASCHMPPSGSIDIPHVNITDHYISRDNILGKARVGVATGEPAFLGLKILTKDKATPEEMAKAYLAMYDKYTDSAIMLDSAWHYLQKCESAGDLPLLTAIHYYFAREDYEAIVREAAKKEPKDLNDAWTAYRIGEGYYKTGKVDVALGFYDRATSLMPYHLDFQEKMGAALIKLKRIAEAKEKLQWVIEENSKRPVALTNLGFAFALEGDLATAEQHYDTALTLDPDYIQALLNKTALRLHFRDVEGAKKLITRILVINPAHPQALSIAQQLQMLG